MRRMLWCLVLLSACRKDSPAPYTPPATPVHRTITAAALDSLPVLPVVEGRLVCLSDGRSACPTGDATANWLHDGQYATWLAHRPILVWSPGAVDPMLLGEPGNGDDHYDFVVSVAPRSSGYRVLSAEGAHMLDYDAKGRFQSSVPIPPETMTRVTGYSGDVPFFQVIVESGKDSAAVYEVREIAAPGDTVGRTVLSMRLDWLRVRDGRALVPVPLFPTVPSYAIAADSDIVWSPGDHFVVERRSPAGQVRWSLTSDATGPAVTSDEIADARQRLPAGADRAARAHFDSSVANTGRFHAAIGLVMLAPDGRVLAAGVPTAAGDSTGFVMLSNSGEPVARFFLRRTTRVLLYAGDSLLTQRAGANAQPELRWLVVKAPATP